MNISTATGTRMQLSTERERALHYIFRLVYAIITRCRNSVIDLLPVAHTINSLYKIVSMKVGSF